MLPRFRQERKEAERMQRTYEKQLKPIFRKALYDNIKPIIDYVKLFGRPGAPIESMINPGVWNTAYNKAFQQVGLKAARKEYYYQQTQDGTVKASAFEFFKDVWSRMLSSYATEYVSGIFQSLNDKTVRLIQAALAEGDELGLDKNGYIRWFIRKTNQMVTDRVANFERTEATRISNLGKDIGARSWINEHGGGGYKVWLGRIKRERPEHLALNDTIIPIDDLFDMAGHLCIRPGDRTLPIELAANCQCTCSYISNGIHNLYMRRGRIVEGKLVGAS
jgi:hypothetical protein